MPVTLDEWLEMLENRRPEHQVLFGTDRIAQVLPLLTSGKPVAKKVITVAGTNGKGSTVAFLESMLSQTKLNYGATCSPHLFSYNERIRINGDPVSDELICASFERIEKFRQDTFISFFEFFALASFDIFAQSNLDVVVLEIGLGGRLDAMNVIDPDVAVITTVDFDHQEWLGNTIEEIAAEKAGIIRPEIPVIYGDSPVPTSIQKKISSQQAMPFYRNKHFSAQLRSATWDFHGLDLQMKSRIITDIPVSTLPLTSALCAVEAIIMSGVEISDTAIIEGVANTRLCGRNQNITLTNKRGKKVALRLDVAHNPQATKHLAAILKDNPCKGKRIALVAIKEGKDYASTLSPLLPLIDQWKVSTIDYKSIALSGEILYEWLQNHHKQSTLFPSIEKAVKTSVDTMNSDDELVVLGSFHTVQEVLKVYGLDHF